MELLSHKPSYIGKFGDKRLDKRADKIALALLLSRVSTIKGSTHNGGEEKGFYRFLENEKVEETKLIDEMKSRCTKNARGRDVLVIQDTTEIGLSNHTNRIKSGTGVGLAGNAHGLGFMLHAGLVFDANKMTCLGFSDVQLWHRDSNKRDNQTKKYKKLPIEEKESYRWIKGGEESKKVLSDTSTITIIEDREGDIYEQFATIPDNKTNLIVRSRDNRKLSDGRHLYDVLTEVPPAGRYLVKIIDDMRKEEVGRIATMEVRHTKVRIGKPAHLKKSLPEYLELYAVETKEVTPKIKRPLKWRLLTTQVVNNYQEAVDIINQYRHRWYIEQVFRLLKKKGFRIEDSELSNGWAIRKLTIMVLNTVLRVIQMYMAYNNSESQPIKEVFCEEEIKCLKVLNNKYEGKTDNTKNKNNPKTLAWATWIIARLGGWKGNKNQRPPGPITLKRGLDKFASVFEGWILAKGP